MKRNELEAQILKQYSELKLINLKNLSKSHLESWINNGEISLSVEVLVKIFAERNQRAKINQQLNNENFSLTATIHTLTAKLDSLTDWSKSEIIHAFKTIFSKVTKADDEFLSEIGAVSKQSVREDLDKAEKIVEDATDIAEKYRKKYGEL